MTSLYHAELKSVNAATSNVVLLEENDARYGVAFYNDSDKSCYLKLGEVASSTSFTIKMSAGSYYEVPRIYTGHVDCIWEADVTGAMRITEF